MLTGYERAKVREATLTFPVLLLLRLLRGVRGWANNQFSELIAAFPRQPIGLSKKLYTVLLSIIETVQFLWPCVNTKAGDSV